MTSVTSTVAATDAAFSETGYLTANADVAKAVKAGIFRDGLHHYTEIGHRESRVQIDLGSIEKLRLGKLDIIERLIRKDAPFTKSGHKYNFLSDDLKRQFSIVETDLISSHGYDAVAQEVIARSRLVLDCGSGFRPVYYGNVINYEIVDYATTDVIGVGESLPFKGGSFDAVLSIAVLEHVKDPFLCASEIKRVLKPGGTLVCAVPFLQPYHGYPSHYFNMTWQGLRSLFDGDIQIDQQFVPDVALPIWATNWILKSWADGLNGSDRDAFLSLTVADLMEDPWQHRNKPWVRGLSDAKNFELACGTMIIGTKK